MSVYFISRHQGAKDWALENNIQVDHWIEHLDMSIIKPQDKVYGTLPIHIAAKLCDIGAQYWHLSLEMPAQARGMELSAQDMRNFGAHIQRFIVRTEVAPAPKADLPVAPSKTAPNKSTVKEKPASPEASLKANPAPAAPSNQKQITPKEWPQEVFLAFARGNKDAEHYYEAVLARAQIEQAGNIDLHNKIRKSAKRGRYTASLLKELKRKLEQGVSKAEIIAWINEPNENKSKRVVYALNKALAKHVNWQANCKAKYQANKGFAVSLPQVNLLANGLHPQSLRAQKPHSRWDVYIDETGSEFSRSARDFTDTDNRLGRIVSLWLPQGHKLAAMNAMHATDKSNDKIEALLKTLTQTPCAVFGGTLAEDLASDNWLAAIAKHLRWGLLQLPMKGPTHVYVQIENRAPFTASTQLDALAEVLVDGLRSLAPERFSQLNLTLGIMDKNAPLNPYVDVIANCWGSQDQNKRKLLARTLWRGHCLLQSSLSADIERLYQALSDDISPALWFDLFDVPSQEANTSLFTEVLERLGEKVQAEPKRWQGYVQEAHYRISQKRFHALGLGMALAWLERFAPSTEKLPAILRLELGSLSLAAANHLGQYSQERSKAVLDLADTLIDEDAQRACNAVLRVAIAATNHYQFDSAQSYIEHWLALPVSSVGIANHAKLHSTLGQLYAFNGQHTEAIACFDKALATFAKLSDRQDAARNSLQTQSYRAIELLNSQAKEAWPCVLGILEKAASAKAECAIEQLARSGDSLRFSQYLLLKALAKIPSLEKERACYVAQAENWQQNEGHPWMLINTYRAWLLYDAGQKDSATALLQKAMDDCLAQDEATTLHFMAHCLYALGQSLGLRLEAPDKACPEGRFPAAHLPKLASANDNSARLEALAALLPFNFH